MPHILTQPLSCPALRRTRASRKARQILFSFISLQCQQRPRAYKRAVSFQQTFSYLQREIVVRFCSRNKRVFLFQVSISVLGPTQPQIQWVQEITFSELKRPRREGGHSPYLVPRLRMGGTITPLPLDASMGYIGINIPLR